MRAKFCGNCGNEMKDGVKFCSNCGWTIDSAEINDGGEEGTSYQSEKFDANDLYSNPGVDHSNIKMEQRNNRPNSRKGILVVLCVVIAAVIGVSMWLFKALGDVDDTASQTGLEVEVKQDEAVYDAEKTVEEVEESSTVAAVEESSLDGSFSGTVTVSITGNPDVLEMDEEGLEEFKKDKICRIVFEEDVLRFGFSEFENPEFLFTPDMDYEFNDGVLKASSPINDFSKAVFVGKVSRDMYQGEEKLLIVGQFTIDSGNEEEDKATVIMDYIVAKD